jgi:hypothetical protein
LPGPLTPLSPYLAILIGLYVFENAWLAAGLYHWMILMSLVRGRVSPRVLASGWRSRIGIPLALASASSGLLLYLLWPLIGLEGSDLLATVTAWDLGGARLWLFCLYFSTVGAVLEELLWRHWLGSRTGWLHWRDAVFAAYHALVLGFFVKPVWMLVIVLVLFATAWIWRITANRTGGLAIPVVSHVVADLSVVIALFLLLKP